MRLVILAGVVVGLVALVFTWNASDRSGGGVTTPESRTPGETSRSGDNGALVTANEVVQDGVFISGDSRTTARVVTADLSPIVVAGKVIDDLGQPVRDAKVVARPLDHDRRQSDTKRAPTKEDNVLFGRSDRDGQFEVRGETDSTVFAVTASLVGYSSQTLGDVRAGTRDLVLTLERSGSVVGAVLTDESAPLQSIELTALPIGVGLATPTAIRTVRPSPIDGRFLIDGLQDGDYTVSCRLSGTEQWLFQLDGVTVVRGDPTRDPRLEPIDLRGRIQTLDIHVMDARGEPVQRARVAYRPAGEEDFAIALHTQKGDLSINTIHEALDLRITAKGHLQQDLFDIRTDQVVVLPDAPQVRIALEGGLPQLEEGFQLGVQLRPENPDQAASTLDRGWFDESGELTLTPATGGRYIADLRLTQRDGRRSLSMRVRTPTSITIDVLESAGEQVFWITCPPGALERTRRLFNDG